MSEQTSSIISKVWGMCGPLRDDGVSYRNTKSAAFWICALRSSIGQAAPAGGGLSPLGENSRAQKRRPTPIEICPLKAVCR